MGKFLAPPLAGLNLGGFTPPELVSPRLTVIDRKVSTTSLVEYTYMCKYNTTRTINMLLVF